ncbi:MAG: histidine kinase [Bacteroidales bacterium]|nr:histidine kinase [Bacteroidales bacterium]
MVKSIYSILLCLLSLSPILLVSLSPRLLNAQEFSYRHYTVQDGLVQSQVWPLFQDSKGYIWAGTKGGVSRFDGVLFQNFSHNDGLPGNFIHQIAEDSRGNVWFLTMEGLAEFDGEKILGFSTDHFRNSYGFIRFTETEPGVILIIHTRLNNDILFTEFREGQYIDIPFPFSNAFADYSKQQRYYSEFDPLNTSFLHVSNSFGLLRIKGQDVDTLFKNIEKLQDLEIGLDGKLYLMANDTVFQFVNDTARVILDLKPAHGNFSPENFKIDKSGRVYFINHKNQLVIYEEDQMITENFDFPLINTILIDNENNVWLGTESGLYRMISRAFVNYIPGECGIKELIWSISEDKSGRMWFASYSEGLQYYDGEQFTTERSYFSIQKDALYYFHMGSIIDHNGDILFPVNNIGGIKYDGRRFTNIFPDNVRLVSFIFFEDPEKFDLYAGTNYGLYRFGQNGDYKVFDIRPGDGKSKIVVSIVKDKLNRFWLGGFNGICILDGEFATHLPTSELPFEGGGNAMVTDSVGNIWVGNTDGLFCYDFQSFERIQHDGLNSMVTSLALIGDSALLVGSLSGLAILDLDTYYADKQVSVALLGEEEGFHGMEPGQNVIFKDSRGQYWIACNDRVVRFDPAKLNRNLVPPSIIITGVSLLNERMEWVKANKEPDDEFYSFSHDEKNLRFEFTGISTTAPEKVKYSYFLEGYDQGWSEPGINRFVVYTNLSPGPYKLWLKSCNGNGIWSDEAASVNFQIIPALYQRRIFWIICLSMAAAFFVFLGIAISNRKKRKMQVQFETEKKMAQLQLLTLKNQIDPHFTYNAINSMASAVLKEDREQAYRFFVKFSNLVRSIMRSSDQLVRSLEEEIAFVRDYLEIQKFRHKERFEFSITIGPGVNLQKMIPKMTIQTFAENALKHGLLHLVGNGKILIGIFEVNGDTRIEIEDNGIGREKAKQFSVNSTGKGLMILRGYFDYYNRFNADKLKFEIIDLYDDDKQPKGTKIVIDIPAGFSFDEK